MTHNQPVKTISQGEWQRWRANMPPVPTWAGPTQPADITDDEIDNRFEWHTILYDHLGGVRLASWGIAAYRMFPDGLLLYPWQSLENGDYIIHLRWPEGPEIDIVQLQVLPAFYPLLTDTLALQLSHGVSLIDICVVMDELACRLLHRREIPPGMAPPTRPVPDAHYAAWLIEEGVPGEKISYEIMRRQYSIIP